ncbi:MAG: aminotransferase class I/II-fold pyridoxal phosphate-dependent enzyme [Mycobacteriales bacterium]
MNVTEHYRVQGGSATEIVASVESAIRRDSLGPGAALPTVRTLATQLGVSPTTVAAAYRALRERGLIRTDGRRGTWVAHRPPVVRRGLTRAPVGLTDLVAGVPDPGLLPDLAAALGQLREGARLYPDQPTLPALDRLARDRLRADGLAAEALTVVGGALDGIERALLAWVPVGSRIAIEDPGYPPALDLVAALGLKPVAVCVDDAGPDPAALRTALEHGVSAVLVTPRAQNPTGAAFTTERAAQLRKLLADHRDVLLLEDDHAGEIAGSALASLAGSTDRWIHVRSVSKTLGPDLRLAVLVGDETSVARVEGRRSLGTGWVSTLIQELVTRLWQDPAVARQLDIARRVYAERRTALLAALATVGVAGHGRTGLNVWVPVPDEAAAVQALAEAGFAASAGDRFRLRSAPGIRISIGRLAIAQAPRVAAALAHRSGTGVARP